MIIRILKDSKYYDYYINIIKLLDIDPDIIDIYDNQITLYFIDKMSELYNGEKIEHNYKTINKIENYFKLINNSYVNSMLIDINSSNWIDDLYSYTYEIKIDIMRDQKLKKLGI